MHEVFRTLDHTRILISTRQAFRSLLHTLIVLARLITIP